MGMKKLGKFIAFTTAVAAIGGACYIFRDKIKESELYQKATDKLAGLLDKDGDEDDFFFDDDFAEDGDASFGDTKKNGREYTSITAGAKEEDVFGDDKEESLEEEPVGESQEDDKEEESAGESQEDSKEENEKSDDDTSAKDKTSTFSFGAVTIDDDTADEQAPEADENEGLSDVSEDPDVLEEQDKLDF